jgi:hypothetical protein
MKREDVLQVDALKAEIASAFQDFSRRLGGVFDEVVYAVDTVVDRYNTLDAKHDALAADHTRVVTQLETISARLLALEQLREERH